MIDAHVSEEPRRELPIHSRESTPAAKSSPPLRTLIAGTRGSALARCQTESVIKALVHLAPHLHFEQRIIKTAGDKDVTRPLAEIGGLGVFTKEIENALLGHEIDLAVHSLKDLPTVLAPGLRIAAITKREDARDCLISRHNLGLTSLPPGARVGTSSTRRMAQVLAARPDLKIVPLRGNVDTRLHKAMTVEYDAIIIAAAGLARLNLTQEITEYLPIDLILPDPGQGALAVEIRDEDQALAELLSQLDHSPSRAAVTAERALLNALGGGCRTPIGAYAEVDIQREAAAGSAVDDLPEGRPIRLWGMVASRDGRVVVRGDLSGDTLHAEDLGTELARRLLERGAAEILRMEGSAGKSIESSPIGVQPNQAGGPQPTEGEAKSPLQGRRIIITRAREQGAALADKIRLLGGEPIQVPAIEFTAVEDSRELDAALAKLSEFDWIVFTSANGVRAVADRLRALDMDPHIVITAKVAAIGPATANALRELGVGVDFVPTKFLGDQIALELPILPNASVILLRADIASDALAKGLGLRGARVTDMDAYRTIRPASRISNLPDADAVIFTSSSTVWNLVSMLGNEGRQDLDRSDIFCIGPVTERTAREMGLRVAGVATEHTTEGLVETLVEYYRH